MRIDRVEHATTKSGIKRESERRVTETERPRPVTRLGSRYDYRPPDCPTCSALCALHRPGRLLRRLAPPPSGDGSDTLGTRRGQALAVWQRCSVSLPSSPRPATLLGGGCDVHAAAAELSWALHLAAGTRSESEIVLVLSKDDGS